MYIYIYTDIVYRYVRTFLFTFLFIHYINVVKLSDQYSQIRDAARRSAASARCCSLARECLNYMFRVFEQHVPGVRTTCSAFTKSPVYIYMYKNIFWRYSKTYWKY